MSLLGRFVGREQLFFAAYRAKVHLAVLHDVFILPRWWRATVRSPARRPAACATGSLRRLDQRWIAGIHGTDAVHPPIDDMLADGRCDRGRRTVERSEQPIPPVAV